jgi:NADH-quinone oxidoreductase subunit G
VTAAVAAGLPALAGIVDAAPQASFRLKGMKIAREPHRYSGRTAMRANQSVHEPRQPQDADTAMSFSMEGYNGVGSQDRPAALTPFAWSPGWNSPSAWNKFQDEIGGALRGGDAGVQLFANGAKRSYFSDVPAGFKPSSNGFRVLALHQHFGEDELSSRAEPIRERMPLAHVAISRGDAERLGVNGHAQLQLDGVTLNLPTRISDALPLGVVGLPAGFDGVPFLLPGTVAQLAKGV